MGALPREEKQASLEGSFVMDVGRSMRAMKYNLPTPSGEVEEFRRPSLDARIRRSTRLPR